MQLKYLKELMESVDFTTGSAHPDYILNQKERHYRISVLAGENYVFAYTYKGDTITLNLERYKGKTLAACWMNPANGARSYIDTYTVSGEPLSFRPTRRRELSNDWVLILTTE